MDVVIHHLENISVAGDDQCVNALGRGLPGQGSQDIVRLETFSGEDWDIQGCDNLFDALNLRVQLLRSPLSVAFVRFVHVVPEGPANIERHGDVFRLLIAQDIEQHRGEAKDGVGQLARGRAHIGWQGVKRSEGQAVSVDQDELGHLLTWDPACGTGPCGA